MQYWYISLRRRLPNQLSKMEETDYTQIIDWDKVKCPKCGGRRFLGKYCPEPYCIDCGIKFNVKDSLIKPTK